MNDELSPTCGRVRNELPAFLYGELAPDSHAALEQHIDACVPCREELNALRETQRLLSRWETPVVNDDPRQLARAIAAQAGARSTAAVVLRPASPRRARVGRELAVQEGRQIVLHAAAGGGEVVVHVQVSSVARRARKRDRPRVMRDFTVVTGEPRISAMAGNARSW